ncbi:hypothetical protein [Treponema bryantii]|uniref:hypothetical protein n=1 Tax=Treponema bryantii TaxID=163 RepID=UPI002B285081|nr:hypothetical protein TRBR_27060 [Treponema bryantii]
MKKRHLFWIIPCGIILLAFLVALIGHIASPVPSKKYVAKYKERKTITEKELEEDLEYLKYYFTYSYCGYAELVEAGFDIDALIADIKKDCDKNKHGSTYDASDVRANIAKRVLQHHCIDDNHFAVCGESKLPNSLYFTDIYVKPLDTGDEKKYIVVKNERDPFPEKVLKRMNKYVPADIQPGQFYTGPESMLYEWFDGKEKIYRVGTLSRQNVNNIQIMIDRKRVTAPVVSNNSLERAGKMQGMRETNDTLYISLVDFMFGQSSKVINEKEFDILCENTRIKSRGKKQIIIDLRSNPGGYGYRAAMLYSYLFYNQHEEIPHNLIEYICQITEDGEYISMCPTYGKGFIYSKVKALLGKIKALKFQKKSKLTKTYFERYNEKIEKRFQHQFLKASVKELFIPYSKAIKLDMPDPVITELPAPDFSGDIYVLTDKYSASCSEYSIATLRNLAANSKVTIHHIGENTRGAVFFIDVNSFIMPNSGAWISLPTGRVYSDAFDHPTFHGEGYGWFPEYWVTHYNLLNTLCNLIDDPELETALQGLEKWQLQ